MTGQTRHGYAVMTYARTGATYFAQLLGSTGCLGRPEDWFNGTGYRNRGVAGYPLDREGQLAMVMSEGRSANGVFGVKLSPVRCDELDGFAWAERLGPMSFIHLTRNDRLGQAISDVKAQQTGQYRSTTRAEADARYDRRMIARSLDAQLLDEARVRRFFAINGIVPLELCYEDLLADEAAALNRVAKFLSVDQQPAADYEQVELAMQRDDSNQAWRERFIAEYGDLSRMGTVAPRPRWRDRLVSKLR